MSPLLSFLALSAANPVFLTSANGNIDAGKYVVEIRGESAIEPAQVSGRVNGRVLTLYVAGGKVRGNNRAWGQGDERVNAHRHSGKVELEATLPSDGCAGTVSIAAGGEAVVVASVRCAALTAAAKPAKSIVNVVAVAAPKAAPGPTPKPEVASVQEAPAPLAAPATPSESDALLAAVALSQRPEPSAAAPSKVEAVKTVASVDEPSRPVSSATKATDIKNVVPVANQASLWAAGGKALLPVVIFGALAYLGLRFAKKRRSLGRHVKILETTTLGPKRSLIVAQVGGETLLLGSSEAGISLIQVRPNLSVDDAPMHRIDDDVEVSPKWSDALPADFIAKPANDEEGGQAKMLSRLFRKRRQEIPEAWPFADVLDASLMADSVEDRELRDKLVRGMEARVP